MMWAAEQKGGSFMQQAELLAAAESEVPHAGQRQWESQGF